MFNGYIGIEIDLWLWKAIENYWNSKLLSLPQGIEYNSKLKLQQRNFSNKLFICMKFYSYFLKKCIYGFLIIF